MKNSLKLTMGRGGAGGVEEEVVKSIKNWTFSIQETPSEKKFHKPQNGLKPNPCMYFK